MNSIVEIKNEVLSKTSESDRRVKGLWSVDCLYSPIGNGRVFNYTFVVSQTLGQGCSYSIADGYERSLLHSFIGKDFLETAIEDKALLVSFLDSCYLEISDMKPSFVHSLEGRSEKKMRGRSLLIKSEAEHLLGKLEGKKIVNVGVVGDIVHVLSEAGADVCGTDFDETIVGKKLFDTVPIYHGNNTENAVAQADLCVVTGMTIATETIDDIINACINNNTKIIVFAETGANLFPYYINKGVHSYLGETFPFYIFDGLSRINVCRG